MEQKKSNSKFHITQEEKNGGAPPSSNRFIAKTEEAKVKAAEIDVKLHDAREKLPKQRKLRFHKDFDTDVGKVKPRLHFEESVKPQGKHNLAAAGLLSAGRALDLKVHSEIHEVEQENAGVEAAHKTELVSENLTVSCARAAYRHHKNVPYNNVGKLEQKSTKAAANYQYCKTVTETPDLQSNSFCRFRQKQKIKKEYQKAARQARKDVERAGKAVKDTASVISSATRVIAGFATTHKMPLIIAGLVTLLIVGLSSCMSSCSSMLVGAMSSIVATSYDSEDADIYAANNTYSQMESALQSKVNNIESTHPGYDEYRYDVVETGHNPYELTSYLTAKFQAYTTADVQSELQALFDQQYNLTLREEVEVRYRTETRTGTTTTTDPDTGETTTEEYTYEVEVAYNCHVLNVSLTNKTLPIVANSMLTSDQTPLYVGSLSVYGNKPYLWDDIYSTSDGGDYGDYQIPGEALSDPAFAALIAEATKYLGYPYVWGGSSPHTSFDCSGFICWVFTHSGVHDLPRTTAQGIYNQCAIVSPSDAKPGDIIFFTGTYASAGPVSHVAIYIGKGMMIHCGNPIQYANINTKYWQQHFYAFGRLN